MVFSGGGGGSTGLLEAGISPQGLYSSANKLSDFNGQDIFAGGSAKVLGGVGSDYSWNKNEPSIWTVTAGPQAGFVILGGEGHGGSTYNTTLDLLAPFR